MMASLSNSWSTASGAERRGEKTTSGKRFVLAILAAALLLGATSCAGPEPEYRPTSTIKEVMDSVVDVNADLLWNSVATEVSAKGTIERAPQNDDDWKALRRSAISLIEASNILQIPGRMVAKPGEKSENPGIEQSPEVIKTLIDSDRASWIRHAHGLHDATTAIIKAIDAKDTAALLEAGDTLDKACEACHKQYWYPEGGFGSGSVKKGP